MEVKTGRNQLGADQLDRYLDICRSYGFDTLITISNEIPVAWGEHPTKIDRRKLRKVDIHHWSWTYLLSTAVVQKEHRGVSDPEQAWILGELIRYLEHPRSGALEFDDMGGDWVGIRQAVKAGTLRPADKGGPEIVAKFDALLRYVSLRLGRQLGADVIHVRSRREQANPAVRAQDLLDRLVDEGKLRGAVRIPDTVSPLSITADLRSGVVECSVDLPAPQEGRSKTRVNWLIRQLKDAPDDLRVEAFFVSSRGPGTAELLASARESPELLAGDSKREIKSFRITHSVSLGTKRGRGQGAFIDSVVDGVDLFYGAVVQHLKPWSAKPPRLRDPEVDRVAPPELSSSALSSQDDDDDPGVGQD